jgi:hypothetical protein
VTEELFTVALSAGAVLPNAPGESDFDCVEASTSFACTKPIPSVMNMVFNRSMSSILTVKIVLPLGDINLFIMAILSVYTSRTPAGIHTLTNHSHRL